MCEFGLLVLTVTSGFIESDLTNLVDLVWFNLKACETVDDRVGM